MDKRRYCIRLTNNHNKEGHMKLGRVMLVAAGLLFLLGVHLYHQPTSQLLIR